VMCYPTVKKFDDMFSLFERIPPYERRTSYERRTDLLQQYYSPRIYAEHLDMSPNLSRLAAGKNKSHLPPREH